ncbi:serpin family protein [Paenibacillus methanolicus]|uniref:Serpin B n=1 Tax=Paenibacillus methanolicus TaxID=582686 RepID=A0A5S5BVA0_9BACL|nr:serpin family protein [Paenibacillus methanolicus]TYP70236.1 serpin B [Paenibacillus methanolicus]
MIRKIKKGAAMAAAAALLALFAGCGSAPARPSFSAADANRAQIASANAFSMELGRRLLPGTAENRFFSPLSVSMAMGLALNGAAGETRSEMLKTLRAQGLSVLELNEGTRALTDVLEHQDTEVTARIANGAWAQRGMGWKEAYAADLKTYYNAEIQDIDFGDPDAPAAVNKWVDTQTKGMIPRLIESFPPDTVSALVNAIYIKGAWSEPFEEDRTKERPFRLQDGSTASVPMMEQSGSYAFKKEQAYEVLQLPYGEGKWRMTIVLPGDPGGLDALLPQLLDSPETWRAGLATAGGTVRLPRFGIQSTLRLEETLRQLGMKTAFDPAKADFSGMAEEGALFYISQIVHQARIEVDETGTEAAAATAISVAGTAEPQQPCEFTADRPFFFAIEEGEMGAIVFLGVVRNPALSAGN